MGKYGLTNGTFLMCIGVLQKERDGELAGWYKEKILNAERGIGESWAVAERVKLVQAVKLSFINRRENSFEVLKRKYDLPIEYRQFYREKEKFLLSLAKECEFAE